MLVLESDDETSAAAQDKLDAALSSLIRSRMPGALTLVRWSKRGAWQKTWRTIANPVAAWLVHAVVLWSWHTPVLFEATLENESIHALQHASFLFSALLFWWAVIHGRQRALGFGLAVLYMFTTALHSGLLGALLPFANTIWYPGYAEHTSEWGLTPLDDQQLGGAIMMMVDVAILMVGLTVIFWRAASQADAEAPGGEAAAQRELTRVQDEREVQPGVQVAEVGQ